NRNGKLSEGRLARLLFAVRSAGAYERGRVGCYGNELVHEATATTIVESSGFNCSLISRGLSGRLVMDDRLTPRRERPPARSRRLPFAAIHKLCFVYEFFNDIG